MASNADIANRALQKLGEEAVASIFPPDNSKAARAINKCYAILRDNELSAHTWNFAKARTTLPALSVTPSFGFLYQYQLPADCLRILVVGNARQSLGLDVYRTGLEALYKVEGRKILTNLAAPLPLEYITQVTDETLFDSNFVEAFACKIAMETAFQITQNDNKKESLRRDYRRAIREALLSNAIEEPPEGLADDAFSLARL